MKTYYSILDTDRMQFINNPMFYKEPSDDCVAMTKEEAEEKYELLLAYIRRDYPNNEDYERVKSYYRIEETEVPELVEDYLESGTSYAAYITDKDGSNACSELVLADDYLEEECECEDVDEKVREEILEHAGLSEEDAALVKSATKQVRLINDNVIFIKAW